MERGELQTRGMRVALTFWPVQQKREEGQKTANGMHKMHKRQVLTKYHRKGNAVMHFKIISCPSCSPVWTRAQAL